MYESGTILALKEPRPNDPETDEVFPYNRVRVIGASPVSHAAMSEWSGTAAQGVILTPLANFAGVLDEPLGKIQALYAVESTPVREMEVAPKVRIIDSSSAAAGPTPEEVFAIKAPGLPAEEGRTRRRTSSPLVDPRPATDDGPLGKVPAKRGRKPNAA